MPRSKTPRPRFPESVQVGPVAYRVERATLPRNEFGQCNPFLLRVQVREDLPPAQARSVLLHELLHAVSDVFVAGLKERQVRALEAGLACLLRDNPRLVAYLTAPDSRLPR